MATRLAQISSHHVQTIVSEETHKGLRDMAYELKTPVKDILRELITKFVAGEVILKTAAAETE